MQGLRKATNSIGAWGVNLFIPHAFDYDVSRANYPPDWLHQPYWPHFSAYADYTRRISFMNSEDSHHVTNVLLYYPMTSRVGRFRSRLQQSVGLPAPFRSAELEKSNRDDQRLLHPLDPPARRPPVGLQHRRRLLFRTRSRRGQRTGRWPAAFPCRHSSSHLHAQFRNAQEASGILSGRRHNPRNSHAPERQRRFGQRFETGAIRSQRNFRCWSRANSQTLHGIAKRHRWPLFLCFRKCRDAD